jgi:hypothetical protein
MTAQQQSLLFENCQTPVVKKLFNSRDNVTITTPAPAVLLHQQSLLNTISQEPKLNGRSTDS